MFIECTGTCAVLSLRWVASMALMLGLLGGPGIDRAFGQPLVTEMEQLRLAGRSGIGISSVSILQGGPVRVAGSRLSSFHSSSLSVRVAPLRTRQTALLAAPVAGDRDRSVAFAPDPPEGHSPRGALKRALVPGWGQIYNRQYYKLPFVYLGIGGFIAGVVYVNDRYLLYRHAALYRQLQERPEDSDPAWERFEEAYRRVVGEGNTTVSSADLRRIRDNFRRNRDLLVIGSVLYYGLTILDAYVSAHLLDFDVSDDLGARLQVTPAGASLRVRF